ncbi:hypothetical protein PLANPX_3903 [Lacipirellula parvula]|uniref:Uncharacterized protein n=1 Tax=Lacipirellula parvula TaxID=2650471 RepID=A0A5K7XH69_9BACT|nr:hypothetical protein PLANPX_3903 [Lacipirellula parvula]
MNGPKYLLGSNVDWGQDFLYLRDWLNKRPTSEPVHLAFHGNLDPTYFGLDKTLPWPEQLPSANSAANGEQGENPKLNPACYVLSVNFLHGASWAARDGSASLDSNSHPSFHQARGLKPTAFAGYSLWVFR